MQALMLAMAMGYGSAPGVAVMPAALTGPGASSVTMAAPKGRRIDLELQAVDIHQVLRLFSEIGRVNIVAKPGVSGTVTAKLRGVPWTEALRGILRSLHLGMIWEGNVIYVTALDSRGLPEG